jgi:AAA15 family ATPase/GTPase
MKLNSADLLILDYPGSWKVTGCTFGDINLIVGKNASGKTRIINTINIIADLLSGEKKGIKDTIPIELKFNFTDEHTEQVYELFIFAEEVRYERLTISGKNRLNRKQDGEGKIWAEKLDSDIDFQVPKNELAALKKQDSIQHPFLNDLYAWAQSLICYRFGTSLGKENYYEPHEAHRLIKHENLKDTSQVAKLFEMARQELGESFTATIKQDMNQIGYKITEFNQLRSINTFPKVGIALKEESFIGILPQDTISQGMFRALSLIIQINIALFDNKPRCILIDDIGEGLDYERSSSLIKLLIEKAKSSPIQLIMTTNDRFVMNAVPLEYWSLIETVEGGAKIYNIRNSPQIFEEFKFTGLNNFDFFASNFYKEGFDKE